MFDALMVDLSSLDDSLDDEVGQAELWALRESLSPEPEPSIPVEITALGPDLVLAATLV